MWIAELLATPSGRRAAIKLLHPKLTLEPDMVARFFNEARAATAISDPGIVQVFDFGHHDDGTGYIAMELLEGESLAARLQHDGPLPTRTAMRLMRQVAKLARRSATQSQIVHRDLKPENIFIVRRFRGLRVGSAQSCSTSASRS